METGRETEGHRGHGARSHVAHRPTPRPAGPSGEGLPLLVSTAGENESETRHTTAVRRTRGGEKDGGHRCQKRVPFIHKQTHPSHSYFPVASALGTVGV